MEQSRKRITRSTSRKEKDSRPRQRSPQLQDGTTPDAEQGAGKSDDGAVVGKSDDVAVAGKSDDVAVAGKSDDVAVARSSCDDSQPGSKPGSPDPNCSICLGKLENKSFTDNCFHMFCFVCLLEWSKVKAVCPLCKQPFKSIIHNVRSIEDYEQYHLQTGDLGAFDDSNGRRFRYNSTMTSERWWQRQRREQQRQLVLLQRPTRSNTHIFWQRQRQASTSAFRRRVYASNMRVVDTQNNTTLRPLRYRDISPNFFRANPACSHRLVPWLNRELNVLLQNHEDHVQFVLELILDLVKRFPIHSEEFREHISPFTGRRTDHFIHEFQSFARSPYDIAAYDRNAVYEEPEQPVHALIESSSSSDNNQAGNDGNPDNDDRDSDIIVVSPQEVASNSQEAATSTAGSADVYSSLLNARNLATLAINGLPQDSAGNSLTPLLMRVHSFLQSLGSPGPSQSGWESPLPGTSSIWSVPSVNSPAGTLAHTAVAVPSLLPASSSLPLALDLSLKLESQRKRPPPVSDEATQSDLEAHSVISSHSSDIVVVGFDKPWTDRSPIMLSSAEDSDAQAAGRHCSYRAKKRKRRHCSKTPPPKDASSLQSPTGRHRGEHSYLRDRREKSKDRKRSGNYYSKRQARSRSRGHSRSVRHGSNGRESTREPVSSERDTRSKSRSSRILSPKSGNSPSRSRISSDVDHRRKRSHSGRTSSDKNYVDVRSNEVRIQQRRNNTEIYRHREKRRESRSQHGSGATVHRYRRIHITTSGDDLRHEMRDSERHEMRDSERHEMRDSERHEMRDSERHEMRDSERHEMRDSERHEMRDSERHDVRNSGSYIQDGRVRSEARNDRCRERECRRQKNKHKKEKKKHKKRRRHHSRERRESGSSFIDLVSPRSTCSGGAPMSIGPPSESGRDEEQYAVPGPSTSPISNTGNAPQVSHISKDETKYKKHPTGHKKTTRLRECPSTHTPMTSILTEHLSTTQLYNNVGNVATSDCLQNTIIGEFLDSHSQAMMSEPNKLSCQCVLSHHAKCDYSKTESSNLRPSEECRHSDLDALLVLPHSPARRSPPPKTAIGSVTADVPRGTSIELTPSETSALLAEESDEEGDKMSGEEGFLHSPSLDSISIDAETIELDVSNITEPKTISESCRQATAPGGEERVGHRRRNVPGEEEREGDRRTNVPDGEDAVEDSVCTIADGKERVEGMRGTVPIGKETVQSMGSDCLSCEVGDAFNNSCCGETCGALKVDDTVLSGEENTRSADHSSHLNEPPGRWTVCDTVISGEENTLSADNSSPLNEPPGGWAVCDTVLSGSADHSPHINEPPGGWIQNLGVTARPGYPEYARHVADASSLGGDQSDTHNELDYLSNTSESVSEIVAGVAVDTARVDPLSNDDEHSSLEESFVPNPFCEDDARSPLAEFVNTVSIVASLSTDAVEHAHGEHSV